MIERIWRGRATIENAPKYQKHVTEHVFSELNQIPGFMGARLLKRQEEDEIEFLAVTMWESLAAIKGFAGDNIETAIVEPAAREVLCEFDEFATHFEIVYSKAVGTK
ncbi:MAG: antibiotic biosynthesis monooxygenase [Negativicutes bacterium]